MEFKYKLVLAPLKMEEIVANHREISNNLELEKIDTLNMHIVISVKWEQCERHFLQIKELQNSFIAADDLLVGSGNKIPLWMFGLLY